MTQEPNKTNEPSSAAETEELVEGNSEETTNPEPAAAPTIGRKAIWVVGALVAIYFIGDGIIGLIAK